MKKAIVFFADGMEECEALIAVDILRRAKIDVTTVSINGGLSVTSSHNIELKADAVSDTFRADEADIVILPGGIPGTPNLAASSFVCDTVRDFYKTKAVAAICAAPSVLGKLGILEGRRFTVYPGFENNLEGAEYTAEAVTVDGNIITGNGLGAAIPFALEIVSYLVSPDKAAEVASQIQYPYYGI